MHEEFNRLYKELYPVLVRQMATVTHDFDRAEDLIQDLFIRVWNYLARGERPANLKAFIYQSYRNAKIDYFRLKHEKITSSLDWLMSSENEHRKHFAADEEKDHEKSFENLLKQLEAIGLESREIECLGRRMMGMKPRQIGKDLGLEPNHVSVIISRALAKLK
jgi:RNA polymerase sigma factor (sigma-70 family)